MDTAVDGFFSDDDVFSDAGIRIRAGSIDKIDVASLGKSQSLNTLLGIELQDLKEPKCHHDHSLDSSGDQRKLTIAFIISILFFIAELAGGLISHSLAVTADSFHLLTDCLSFAVSLGSIYVSKKAASLKWTFGYHRAQVLGALFSLALNWIIVGILASEAVTRLGNPSNLPINAKLMLILSIAALFVNSSLLFVLGHHHHSHHHGKENINVRAAFIHALCDLLCSLGVLISSIVLMIEPSLVWIDPLVTLMFSVFMIYSTIPLSREVFSILMEKVPSEISFKEIENDLLDLNHVKSLHSLRIWSLSSGYNVLMVHLVIKDELEITDVHQKAVFLLKPYNFKEISIQIEIQGINEC